MVWRHRRMLELFTEKPNLYRTRQPKRRGDDSTNHSPPSPSVRGRERAQRCERGMPSRRKSPNTTTTEKS